MATHSSILTWKIPWTEDPGRLQSMGSRLTSVQITDIFYKYKIQLRMPSISIFNVSPLHLDRDWKTYVIHPMLIYPTSRQMILLLIQYYLSTRPVFHMHSLTAYASLLSESFSPINTLILFMAVSFSLFKYHQVLLSQKFFS